MRKESPLEADRQGPLTSRLEAKARDLIQNEPGSRQRWSPAFSLENQATLTLHQIEMNRAREQAVLQNLLLEECAIGTELLQMEARTPRYSPYRFPEREKLQRRLGQLAAERRRFSITQAEKLDGLHLRLLELMGKQILLSADPVHRL